MALIAAKCIRCGETRTRRKEDGLPTCDACAAQLQATREPARSCPVDGAPMEKVVKSNVVMDRCPTCRGIWLDQGELKLLREAVKGEQGTEFALGFVMGMGFG